jgi:hypothetical protein
VLPYFAVTGFVAFMALAMPTRRVNNLAWVFAFVLVLIFVGLRHHVGMDWNNYLRMISWAGKGTLVDALTYAEPGFALMLWGSAQLGFGIYGSNLVGTLIFCAGLFRYARTVPHPWIALVVAMPMLVTVVAMSASRQAVAIGVLLWIVAEWDKSSLLKRVSAVVVAALLHASALVFLAFVAADLKLRPSIKLILIAVFLVASVLILQWSGRADYYDSLYGSGQTELTRSPGAILHVLFNGGPALLYFLLSNTRRAKLLPNQLHRHMALLSVALVPAAFFVSTAASRISLFLFPVSMYIFSSIPTLASSAKDRLLLRYAISLTMIALLFLWLAFANNSYAHLPYGNLLTTPRDLWRLCCHS